MITYIDHGEIFKAKIISIYDYQNIPEGGSIAHDGICLTVFNKNQEKKGTSYEVEVSNETISKTNIRDKNVGWVVGKKINLEKSLRLGDELGGHIVTGHIDGVVKLVGMEKVDKSNKLTFEAPDEIVNFIAPKGSIALNGTSLTVNEIDGSLFTVNIIPHTMKVTTWEYCKPNDIFNAEVDLMARYIARLFEPRDRNENT